VDRTGYQTGAYPDTSQQRTRIAVTIAVVVTAAVTAVAVAAVLLLVTGRDGQSPRQASEAATTPVPHAYTQARDIILDLHLAGLVDAGTCKAEDGIPPATSQQRCLVEGEGDEVIAIVFSDSAGVDDRIAQFKENDVAADTVSTLVRGSTWLVNVGDLDASQRESVRSALAGTLVSLPG
jgi:hypothetical protein